MCAGRSLRRTGRLTEGRAGQCRGHPGAGRVVSDRMAAPQGAGRRRGGDFEVLGQASRGKKSGAGKLWNSKWIAAGYTVSAMLLADGCYYILHVGDCRIYGITGTGIRQLTRDQSWAAEAAEKGILTAEQARRDPRRSVLLQCVGVAESVRPVYLRGKSGSGKPCILCAATASGMRPGSRSYMSGAARSG